MDTYEELHASLTRRGYRDVTPAASCEGTGTVRAVMERAPSAWSASYGRRDVEVIVQRDALKVEQGYAEFSAWADYGPCLVMAVDA